MAKETYYFSHDYNARTDRKMISVIKKHGMKGIGIYWCLVEMLYEESGYVPLEYDSISYELRCEEDEVKSIVEDFALFQRDEDCFWSNSVLARIEKRREKSRLAKESVKERWAKYRKERDEANKKG